MSPPSVMSLMLQMSILSLSMEHQIIYSKSYKSAMMKIPTRYQSATMTKPKIIDIKDYKYIDTSQENLNVNAGDTPGIKYQTHGGSCQCGKKIYTEKRKRNVGGYETEVNEYPWIVSYADSYGIHSSTPSNCSGSLVAANWVATAPHCFLKWADDSLRVNENNLFVVIGAHNWADDSTDTMRKTVAVEKIIIHSNWNDTDKTEDIALIKLAESLDMNVYPPICLPKQEDNYEGKEGVAIGWGRIGFDDLYSDVLNEIGLPVVSDETCRKHHIPLGNNGIPILDGHLCAGGNVGIAECQGDSGGPLMVEKNGIYDLIGITSFGYGCWGGYYDVFTEVAKYRDWIDQQFADNGGAVMCD